MSTSKFSSRLLLKDIFVGTDQGTTVKNKFYTHSAPHYIVAVEQIIHSGDGFIIFSVVQEDFQES